MTTTHRLSAARQNFALQLLMLSALFVTVAVLTTGGALGALDTIFSDSFVGNGIWFG